jgi:flavin reductase
MTDLSDGSLPSEGTYRRAMGRLAAGVVAATTLAGRHDVAMTVNSVTSISLDPLLMLISVRQDGRWHEAVLESGVWGISVLPASARGVADWLATPGRPLHGQLDRVAHHRGVTGVALLDTALATVECRTDAVHPAGDHSLLVGRVVAVGVPPETGPALVHFRGTYTSLA